MEVVPLKRARVMLGRLARGGKTVLISDRGRILARLIPVGAEGAAGILDVAGILEGPGHASISHDRDLYGVRKRKTDRSC